MRLPLRSSRRDPSAPSRDGNRLWPLRALIQAGARQAGAPHTASELATPPYRLPRCCRRAMRTAPTAAGPARCPESVSGPLKVYMSPSARAASARARARAGGAASLTLRRRLPASRARPRPAGRAFAPRHCSEFAVPQTEARRAPWRPLARPSCRLPHALPPRPAGSGGRPPSLAAFLALMPRHPPQRGGGARRWRAAPRPLRG